MRRLTEGAEGVRCGYGIATGVSLLALSETDRTFFGNVEVFASCISGKGGDGHCPVGYGHRNVGIAQHRS